jgi:hypothetical protein
MLRPILRGILFVAGSTLLGVFVLALVIYGYFLNHGPQPYLWHTAELTQEFAADKADEIRSLADYRRLEDRLFEELRSEIVAHTAGSDRLPYNRFNPGSRSDPAAWPVNWNRTYEAGPADGRGAVLLLHGLTDSPYSLRALGERFVEAGMQVVGLRLPGHGTAPSGLLSFEVEDMQAAVRLAMTDLRRRLGPDKPIYIAGYSNGAALAVDYSLVAMDDPGLPRAAGLILISPAIGVSRLAVVGLFKPGLSRLPGFGRAAWQDIAIELDPFKYSSFPFHAAGQTHRLTAEIAERVEQRAIQGPIRGFPRTLAFLSAVDSTVKVDAVADVLFKHLAREGHELVLFDVNRLTLLQPLLVNDPGPITARLMADAGRPYRLTVVTNQSPDSHAVHAVVSEAGAAQPRIEALDLAWPRTVFSVSHVALPFPPDDVLYGYEAAVDPNLLQLGRVAAHGELGVMTLPNWMLVRQRSNPFFPYLAQRATQFVQ